MNGEVSAIVIESESATSDGARKSGAAIESVIANDGATKIDGASCCLEANGFEIEICCAIFSTSFDTWS